MQRLTRIPLVGGIGADSASRIVNSSQRLFEWFLLRGAAQRDLALPRPRMVGGVGQPAEIGTEPGCNRHGEPVRPPLRHRYFRESLPLHIKCPVLIVAGSRDPYVTGIETRRLLSLIPHAESRLVPEAGHLFFAEYREIWQELLSDWLQRLDRK